MIDERTDCLNQEQAVLVLCWVDDALGVHKDFIGLYNVPSIYIYTLLSHIQEIQEVYMG